MTDRPAVLYDLDGHVVTLTINRPEARNAVNGRVAIEMEAALDRYEATPDARVAILTGAGVAFCAGADLKEIAAGSGASLHTKRGGFGGFVIRERSKPVIAAVNGPALAGGCELVLACDMAVAAEGVPIGLPEVKRSLIASAGGLYRLPRAVGPARAAEMVLTGDPITSEEALALGLLNAVVPEATVMAEARELAVRVAVNAPLAVQASRQVLTRSFGSDDRDLDKASQRAFLNVVGTEDFREGPKAFIEKRDPVWKGR